MRLGTKFQVDLGLLAENFKLLRDFAPTNKVIFMVKSNAYGHGAAQIVSYAEKNLDIDRFGVASIGEAIFLKQQYPGIKKDIWCFSETDVTNENVHDYYMTKKIVPVIGSIAHLKYVLTSKLKDIPIVINFDTGMNRLGIPYNLSGEVITLLKSHSIKKINHLMTHFSSSFIKLKEGDRTDQQYKKFLRLKENFSAAEIKIEETSCSNSGAIEQKFALDETHIRPGLMLYGPRSVGSFKKEDALWNGKSISSLRTKILKVSTIKKGVPIGYGGHICHADGIIIYLPLGYGDGILTYYTGLKINYRQMQGKIIGRVNMDLIAVFFEGKSEEDFLIDDEIFIWSHEQDSVVDLANQVKTIPYQVYTAITNRVPKCFK